jgi:hypothetical protein
MGALVAEPTESFCPIETVVCVDCAVSKTDAAVSVTDAVGKQSGA